MHKTKKTVLYRERQQDVSQIPVTYPVLEFRGNYTVRVAHGISTINRCFLALDRTSRARKTLEERRRVYNTVGPRVTHERRDDDVQAATFSLSLCPSRSRGEDEP